MSRLERLRSMLRVGTRTDAVLVVLPLAFIGTFLASHGVFSSIDSALTLASIVCVSLIVDRLFIHPPIDS